MRTNEQILRSVFPTYWIETYGCAFNAADSETLEAELLEAGWRQAAGESDADVVVLNSCTVKDRTVWEFQKRLRSLLERRAATGKPGVVVAGCVPLANPDEPLLDQAVLLGPRSLSRIAEAAETARGGIRSALLEAAGERRLRLPRRRRNPILEILPINQGCLGHCAYCQTRLARGELLSFPIADIVERARRAIGEGARELWLTSQDTGAYGADIGTSLPRLLEALGELEGGHMFRLGMASPHWLKRDMAPLLDALDNPRFYRFIHAPVQSGDDRVLRAMRRPYAVRDFEWAVDAIRSRFPRAAIWTDIIAGFPTETGEEFERTLDLLRRVRPATVNRSRFSPRPGTEAAAMPQLPSGAISERSRRLARLVEDISRESLKEWIGWAGEARIVETKKPGTAMARNFAYRPIALRGDYEPGRIVRVRASGQTTYHLTGSEIKET